MTEADKVKIRKNVFNDVYRPLLEDDTRTQIIFGGSSSGKSVFQAQRTVIDILKGGRNYLVCRAVAKYIRKSVYNEITKVIGNWGLSHLFKINKSEMTITCKNGYQILFVGLDDTEKIKSVTPEKGVITDVWVEEATEATQDAVKQLQKRLRGVDVYSDENVPPKRLIITFNPILQTHWIYEEYFTDIEWADDTTEYRGEDLYILKTWYIHNKFLTADDIKALENERDPYYYQVYTLGNWGVLGAVIFKNWRVEDLSDRMEQFTHRFYGLDFGFSSDHAAVVDVHYDRMRQKVYIIDELYELGLTNDVLAIEAMPIVENNLVTCDSAEPKSILELNRHGLRARGAEKGKDSVMHGIQWLQQQEIIIHISCLNAKKEFQQYQWKEDKDGNAIRQPVDKNNHIIDALRYALEDEINAYYRSLPKQEGIKSKFTHLGDKLTEGESRFKRF